MTPARYVASLAVLPMPRAVREATGCTAEEARAALVAEHGRRQGAARVLPTPASAGPASRDGGGEAERSAPQPGPADLGPSAKGPATARARRKAGTRVCPPASTERDAGGSAHDAIRLLEARIMLIEQHVKARLDAQDLSLRALSAMFGVARPKGAKR